MSVVPTLAAGGHPPTPETIWQAWNLDPVILFGLLLSTWLYARGLLRLRQRTGTLRREHRRRSVSFATAQILLFAALISPLDALGSALLSAHMIQHVFLIAVAAPLFAFSQPLGPLLLGLPGSIDQQLGRWWQRHRALAALWHWISYPLVVWTLYAAALWLWHLPPLYQAALSVEWVHAAEHLSFLGTALLLWWVVADRSRRASKENWLITIGILFTTAIHGGLLGVLMSFAQQPWYPLYGVTVRPWNLSPLADQQLAGVLMWVPPGFVYLGGTLALIYRLIEQPGESKAATQVGKQSLVGLSLAVVLFGLSACFTGPPNEPTSYLVPEGNAQLGWYAVQDHGCHSCHTIPGVPGADTHVGPPLTDWARRRYIAGSLVNVPENLIFWIQYPQEVEPGTAMPNIPMTEEDAVNIAAFLYTLGYD